MSYITFNREDLARLLEEASGHDDCNLRVEDLEPISIPEPNNPSVVESIVKARGASMDDVATTIAMLCQLNGILAVDAQAAWAEFHEAKRYNISELAQRFHRNSANWFPSNHTTERAAVTHVTLGLAGEAGETANKVKKMYGYADQNNALPEDSVAKVIEEAVDALVYDLVLLDILRADIPVEIEKVIAKCVARWGAEASEGGEG